MRGIKNMHGKSTRVIWPKAKFWKRPRLPRGFWSWASTVEVIRKFVDEVLDARTDGERQTAMDKAVEALGGKRAVNAADIVWYARLLHKTGTTQRRLASKGPEYAISSEEGKLGPERVTLGKGGRLVIPVSFRQALHLTESAELLLRLEEGELRISTPIQALQRAQRFVREHVPAGRSLAEELIWERKQEVGNE